jgi:hypothetical protein
MNEPCPLCQSPVLYRCKCPSALSVCDKGHITHHCAIDDCLVAGELTDCAPVCACACRGEDKGGGGGS